MIFKELLISKDMSRIDSSRLLIRKTLSLNSWSYEQLRKKEDD